MIKIKNEEIELSMKIINKIKNAIDSEFYNIYYEVQVKFIAGSITFTKIWGCYHGEVENFKSNLLLLKKQPGGEKVIWTLMNELSILSLEKMTIPYEAYHFTFKFPASVNSDVYIGGQTILDQSYINCIINDINEALHYA